jgi:HAD superfamily hydrolase (TIGR01484 family)
MIEKLLPLAQATLQPKLIATDMDGTLTVNEKFTPELLQALQTCKIPVLIVTGRSAGWVSGIVHYLPVVGAIAENGGLFYTEDTQTLLTPIPDLKQHRQKLAATFDRLKTEFPHLEETSDNAFRLTDWTFDVKGLSQPELQRMDALCQDEGWSFTYSTVQCHIKPMQQSKAVGLLEVLNTQFPLCTPDQIITVGDSPNDETLFECFPYSVGVANILNYCDLMTHHPTYVTQASEGAGFCELIEKLQLIP